MRALKKFMSSTVPQIVLMIILVIVIILEIRGGFKMLYNREMEAVQVFNGIASSAGKARVSIDTVKTYEEIPFTYDQGDIISVKVGDNIDPIKIQVSGELTDNSYSDYGYYYYSDPDKVSATITVMTDDLNEEVKKAVHDFWYGNTTDMYKTMTKGGVTSNALDYYQCSFVTGNAPVMYDENAKLYYMLVVSDTKYSVLQAPNPFRLSDEKVTVHFGDPSIDAPLEHTYSDYETLAAENTIRELLEGDSDDENAVVDNPYKTDETAGAGDYTSDTDDKRRSQMVKLGEYNWDPNGMSTETTMTVDITSQEALQSQWLLTATTYTYENAGIKISGLTANRSASAFKISGNVNNTLSTERPYVMVLKFIDAQGKLVGIKVLDYRTEKLAPEGVAAFSATIPASDMSIASIASVMFDIY